MPSNHLILCHLFLLLPSVFQWRSVLLSSHFSQFSSAAQSCPMLCNSMTAACQASLSITNSRSLFRLMCIESVMPFNQLILCGPILLLPSIFPRIREQTSNYQTSLLFLVMLLITLLLVEASILFSFLSSGWHIYFFLPCL